MSNFGRKIARQVKQNSPEGKEEAKQEQADKKAAPLPKSQQLAKPSRTAPVPQPRMHQRKAGGS
ncbi:MAG: hypothetical protein H7308_09760 [Chthonomonadaceae bacterium]|nr:hypothetical protein [Chthonomonadaceae bacterium]